MNNLNDDIQNRFSIIKHLVYTVTVLYNDVSYLDSVFSSDSMINKKYIFFNRIYNSLYISLINDLHKLFYEKESYSIIKFLNLLANNAKRIQWKTQPDKNLIDVLKNEIIDEYNTRTIDKIKEVRNKYYAHLDLKRPTEIIINKDNIEILISSAQCLVNNINGSLKGEFEDFSMHESELGYNLVTDLIKYGRD